MLRSTEKDVEPGQLPQDPVGRPIMHRSGIKHATGEAVYCDDMRVVDGELFLVLVTSAKAHAKIVYVPLYSKLFFLDCFVFVSSG